MKILDLFPWCADEALIKYEKEFVPDDVDVYGLKKGLQTECHTDLAATLPETVKAIVDAEKKGYDAVVIACFGDIGVEVARSHVNIPVLGPTKVGLHVAAMIGHRICMLLPEYEILKETSRQNVITYGFQDRVVIRGNYASVQDALKSYDDYKATGQIDPFIKELVGVCEKTIEEDRVDVIILGCGGIKWMKDVLENELTEKGYRVTVINPLSAAIEIARSLVRLNLRHNQIGYPSTQAHKR